MGNTTLQPANPVYGWQADGVGSTAVNAEQLAKEAEHRTAELNRKAKEDYDKQMEAWKKANCDTGSFLGDFRCGVVKGFTAIPNALIDSAGDIADNAGNKLTSTLLSNPIIIIGGALVVYSLIK